jgi:hypothetical protein
MALSQVQFFNARCCIGQTSLGKIGFGQSSQLNLGRQEKLAIIRGIRKKFDLG